MNLNDLKKPFARELISWRVGATSGDKTKAIALAYIDARDVMERLDEVCGPQGWQAIHNYAEAKTSCKIGINIDGEWIWKENGAGNSDVEAEKGAFSDSFKRAAVLWGVGRYLYDVPNIWVEIEAFGRSFKIKNPKDPKLAKALEQAEKGIRLSHEEEPQDMRSVQNVLITKVQAAKDKHDMQSVIDEIAPEIEKLPPHMSDLVNQEIENRLEAMENGVALLPPKHKFSGVQDALDWASKMKPVINGFRSTKILLEWQTNNQPFIDGLDCLKAEKYVKDGKSFRERFTDALKAKYEELNNIELSQQPLAAE